MQFKIFVIFAIVGLAAGHPQRGHYAGANRPILGSRYQNEGAQNQASQGQQQNAQAQPAQQQNFQAPAAQQQNFQAQPAQQQNFQAQPAQQQNFQPQPGQVQQSFPSAVVAPTGNRIDGNRGNQNQQGGFGGGFPNAGFGFPHDNFGPHGGFPHGGYHDHDGFGPFNGGGGHFGGFNNGHHF